MKKQGHNEVQEIFDVDYDGAHVDSLSSTWLCVFVVEIQRLGGVRNRLLYLSLEQSQSILNNGLNHIQAFLGDFCSGRLWSYLFCDGSSLL